MACGAGKTLHRLIGILPPALICEYGAIAAPSLTNGKAAMERKQLDLSTAYAAPQSDAEHRLAAIWEDVLAVYPVGLDDDFFDLGGDSMLATLLAGEVSDAFGVPFKPGQLLEAGTPRSMAELLGSSADLRSLPSNIIAINAAGGKQPIFVIHGAAGISFLKPEFLAGLKSEHPIYNFQARGYDGAAEPLDSVEDIAASYLQSMLEINPDGPWNLVAFCGGGWIAVELVHQMAKRNLAPRKVVLVDISIVGPAAREYRIRQQPVVRLNLPVISQAGRHAAVLKRELSERLHMLSRTGHFVNKYDRSAFALPRVRKYLLSRMKRKHGMRGQRIAAGSEAPNGTESADTAHRRQQLARIYASDAAALTSVKLEIAFSEYRPRRLEFPVYLLRSEARPISAGEAYHPLNKYLPAKQIIISGETHNQAVGSAKTAGIIQAILDDKEMIADAVPQ
jgi:thioesterase domain-containing protein/acyl carrier protein